MNNLKTFYVAAALVLATVMPASSAFAGGVSGQRISMINIYGTSTTPYAVFSFDGGTSSGPACATWRGAMAIDITTTRGKAQLQLLTTAFLSGKNVMLTGTNACVTPAGFGVAVETFNYVTIQ